MRRVPLPSPFWTLLCRLVVGAPGQPGREKGRLEAEKWIARAHFGAGEQAIEEAPRPVRLAAAWAPHHRTNAPQGWIAGKLGLHTAANVSQQVRRIDSGRAPAFTRAEEWRRWRVVVGNARGERGRAFA